MTTTERKPCSGCRSRVAAGVEMLHADCFFMWTKVRDVRFPGELEEAAAPKGVYTVRNFPAIVPLGKQDDPEEVFNRVDLAKLNPNSMRYRYEVLRLQKAREAKALQPQKPCGTPPVSPMILSPISRVVGEFNSTMEVVNESVLDTSCRVPVLPADVRVRVEGTGRGTPGSPEGGREQGSGDREGVDSGRGDHREDLSSDRHQDCGDPCSGHEEGPLSDLPLSRPVRPEDSPAPGFPDGVTGAGDSGCKDEDDDTDVEDDDLGHFALRSILNDPDVCHGWPVSPFSDVTERPDWTVPDLPDS